MSMTVEKGSQVTRLTAADPDIAFLASKAAIELDRILQGCPVGTDAVVELGNLLKHSTKRIPGSDEPAALWDPSTISLIHSAIKAEGSRSVVTLEQLMKEAVSIAEELESTTVPSKNSDAIRRLRSFCIGLANSAVANERSQIDSFLEKTLWS